MPQGLKISSAVMQRKMRKFIIQHGYQLLMILMLIKFWMQNVLIIN